MLWLALRIRYFYLHIFAFSKTMTAYMSNFRKTRYILKVRGLSRFSVQTRLVMLRTWYIIMSLSVMFSEDGGLQASN